MINTKKILMIVTSHSQIDANHPTGLWLEEAAVPYLEFKSNGADVVLASVQGGQAPIDPRSKPDQPQADQWAEVINALKATPAIGEFSASEFDALFLPGGHGTMFDMPANQELQRLIREFADADKIIAAVCHGPAALVGVALSDNRPLVAGMRLTAFTDEEERAVELDAYMPFLLETKLRELGARFITQPMWSDHVEQDGNLITGQNPQSSASIARAVIKRLATINRGGR